MSRSPDAVGHDDAWRDVDGRNPPIKTLAELVDMAKTGRLDDYCVYSDGDDIVADELYLTAAYPDVVDKTEVYPDEVADAGFRLVYQGDQFVDVVDVLLEQRPDATLAQIAEALRYFSEHETFLPVGEP